MNDTAPRQSFGAILVAPGITRFRLWAPDSNSVFVEIEGRAPLAMQALDDGWFEVLAECGAGTCYRFRVSDTLAVPDPASRRQAGDVHDASVVTDPGTYRWAHADWVGRPWHEAVIYELHVGAMGGFMGVLDHLPRLAKLGITAIEMMPVADFPGQRNWGYDGVLPYAPDTAYGTPDELKRLVDTAHGLGLMVFLDVVYNHFGPEGNYLGAYASGFYRTGRKTPWGDAIDFRRPQVQRFFIENALYWILEFCFDGLRFDAVHAIDDVDFLTKLASEIRAATPPGRYVHLVLENEHKQSSLLGEPGDPHRFDAQWADDLHHCVHVMLTGEDEGYYAEFAAEPAALLAKTLADGFGLPGIDGPDSSARHLPVTAFVTCLQNHDQVGNRAFGERLHHVADARALRAATILLLLAPPIPLLFMGQEWGTTAPFLFFASYDGELGTAVLNGRRAEFKAFAPFKDPVRRETIPDPNDPGTFHASVPDPGELASPEAAAWIALHSHLLAVRAAEIVPRITGTVIEAAEPIGDRAVRARWRMGDGALLSMLVNLGDEPVACALEPGRALAATGARAEAAWLAGYSAEVQLLEPHHAG